MGIAGQGYLIQPATGPGRGVLVLHSWWGLTNFFRGLCDRLAGEGYTALSPDFFGGRLPTTPDEAERLLGSTDPNEDAGLVLSSARALRAASVDERAPIAVIGFSMGASWGLWLSARSPKEVAAAVAFYGSQSIDFIDSECAYQGHFAEFDALVSEDEVVELEAHLHLVGRSVEFHRYPGTAHWFFEEDRELAFNEAAAAVAWERTKLFLQTHLGR